VGEVMKKAALLVVFSLLVSLVLLLTGCSASEFQKSVYNDDSKLIKQADSYSYKSRVGSTTSEKSEIKFGSFFGMDTLWSIEAKEEAVVTLEYDIKIEKGDFKVVLIGPDNKVITIVDKGNSGKQELRLQKGNSRIKIVGKDAKGQVKINISGDRNLKIKKLNN
jgi:hypothetical protein